MQLARKLYVLVASFFTLFQLAAQAQINSWTNPFSSHWEDPYWSLGSPPGPNQSVFITNTGYKAVGVFPVTSSNFPGSLTVSNLQISAPNNALGTLLLNYSGTTVPLRVLSGCAVGTNGTLLNLYAGFEVDGASGGVFRIQGGSYGEEGGALRASNVTTYAGAAAIGLTNASAIFRDVYLGYDGSNGPATVTQSGGSVAGTIYVSQGSSYQLLSGTLSGATAVGFTSSGQMSQYDGTNTASVSVGQSNYPFPTTDGNGHYSLYGGSIVNNSVNVAASSGYPVGVFDQIGGYINTGSVGLGFSGFSTATFNQHGGVLVAGSLGLENALFNQSGGQCTLGSPLTIAGTFDDYNPMLRTRSSYFQSGGILNTPGVNVGMFGGFAQSGGTNNVAGNLALHGATYFFGGDFLGTSNTYVSPDTLVLSDGRFFFDGDFYQSGGVHWVTNSLTIQDTYALSAGTLFASNIVLMGMLIVSNSSSLLTNPGAFSIAGTLGVWGSSPSLGVLMLSSNALLDFGTGNSAVHFKSSSAVSWSFAKLLVITNWHGNANGGGASQLFAGNSMTGLSIPQLAEIQFVNPAGFGTGHFAARILSSGEIVPVAGTTLSVTLSRPQLVLNWPGGLVLQSATNVAGPFSDLSASSPYTNPAPTPQVMFFRLRH